MLNDTQQEKLLLSLFATAEVMGQQLTQAAALLMVEDLCEFTEPVLTAALRSCRIEGGRLTVASILKHAQSADGRPGKDEAWGIAMAGFDERETVVLTDEMRVAMNSAAATFEAGDKVGARMAFMGAYERLVAQARAEAKPVSWGVSLGVDPNSRTQAIERAVRLQLLPPERAAVYLADLRTTPITEDGQAIAGLLTGEVRAQASPKVREKIAKVRCILKASKAKKDRERAKEAQFDRVDTYLRKRRARIAIAQLNIKRAGQTAGGGV